MYNVYSIAILGYKQYLYQILILQFAFRLNFVSPAFN